jgi:hypothetical protein
VGCQRLDTSIETQKHNSIPSDKNQELKNHLLDGGYTIQTYGSSQFKKRLAAIQIEVIHDIRADTDKRQKLPEDMADCIYSNSL